MKQMAHLPEMYSSLACHDLITVLQDRDGMMCHHDGASRVQSFCLGGKGDKQDMSLTEDSFSQTHIVSEVPCSIRQA
jgi:hypothetical protein